jgi:spore germination protein YaaH
MALSVCSPPAAAATRAGAAARLAVTGYQEESSPVRDIAASAAALTTVGVDGINLTRSGTGVTRPDRLALRQLAATHRRHLRATLLVGNFDDKVDDFSEPIAHRLLANPAATTAVARTLARLVRRQHWDGITVDLESLRRRDRAGLTRFVRALAKALPTGRTVSVDVSNMTHAAQFDAAGYDLRALGRAADEIVLMGYDQHGTWENVPGPVGALAWQRAGLRILLAAVPRRKVTLGVAGYGYAWRPHANVYVSDRRARELVRSGHGHARFDRRVGEWTTTLRDGSTLWWSDARSLALRAQLATRLHLHGLAVWSLGLSDPITA